MRIAGRGLVDRGASVGFRFDGREHVGFAGDTLASALLAGGTRLLGRSFKYHRPRGVMTAGSEEPNALVTVGQGAASIPNVRATMQEIFPGLDAKSQNRWPSLGFDAMQVNDLLSPFFSAGFYYKTFMWPRAFWERLYEPAIRQAAGLGVLSKFTNLFLGVSIVLWLIASREGRGYLKSWPVWAAAALGLVVLVPFARWNMAHDWIGLERQFGRVGANGGDATVLRYVLFLGSIAVLVAPLTL